MSLRKHVQAPIPAPAPTVSLPNTPLPHFSLPSTQTSITLGTQPPLQVLQQPLQQQLQVQPQQQQPQSAGQQPQQPQPLHQLQPVITTPSIADPLGLSRHLSRRRIAPFAASSSSLSLEEFTFREVLRSGEVSVDGSVGLALSALPEPAHLEQQYNKFKIWISESPDSYKPELAQLLYPVFTHLFFEMVCSGQVAMAQKFHKRHQSTFMINAEFASFIRQLQPIQGAEDLHKDPNIKEFITGKYAVNCTHKTFRYLTRYLQTCSSPVLLHIIRSKVDLRLVDQASAGLASTKAEALRRIAADKAERQREKERRERLKGMTMSSNSNNGNAVGVAGNMTSVNSNNAANLILNKSDPQHQLGEVFRGVSGGPSSVPSVAVYRLTNYHAPVTVSQVNVGASLLAAGTEDSAIQLWHLLPTSGANDDLFATPVDSRSNVLKNWRSHQRVFLGIDTIGTRLRDRRKRPAEESIESDSDVNHHDEEEEQMVDCRILRGHQGPVYSVSFIPSEPDLIVSCGEDATLRAWDWRTESNKAVYRGHSYPVWCMDVDALGLHLATGSMDRTAKLWNLEYTHPLRIYAGHERDVDCIAFHPNCNYLATGSTDKTIRLWTHADAKMVRVFNGHRGGLTSLSFSPCGRLLATGSEDRTVRIWDLAASKMLKELHGHAESISALTWSQDSALLCSGGLDGSIKIWEVSTGNRSPEDKMNLCATFTSELLASYATGCNVVHSMRFNEQSGTLLVTGMSVSSTAAASAAAASSVSSQGLGGVFPLPPTPSAVGITESSAAATSVINANSIRNNGLIKTEPSVMQVNGD